MTECKALEALFPGPRRSIVTAFFCEPDRWWSLPELAGRAGLQPGTLRRHVATLREAGFLRDKHANGHQLFQPDPSNPVYSELRTIVCKLTSQTDVAATILVVEDQPATAQITRILLESWGYTVLEAHSSQEAFATFERNRTRIRLLLSDVVMPDMSGHRIADELVRRNPELRVVFMSGYPSDELTGNDTAFLPKPFNPASLSRIVRRELDR